MTSTSSRTPRGGRSSDGWATAPSSWAGGSGWRTCTPRSRTIRGRTCASSSPCRSTIAWIAPNANMDKVRRQTKGPIAGRKQGAGTTRGTTTTTTTTKDDDDDLDDLLYGDSDAETAAKATDGAHERWLRRLRVNARGRCFTVNAMMYDVETGVLYDFAGGLDDVDAKRVRTVRRADESFADDPTRMLRAVRVAARHGLAPTREILASMRAHAPSIRTVPPMRVAGEVEDAAVRRSRGDEREDAVGDGSVGTRGARARAVPGQVGQSRQHVRRQDARVGAARRDAGGRDGRGRRRRRRDAAAVGAPAVARGRRGGGC